MILDVLLECGRPLGCGGTQLVRSMVGRGEAASAYPQGLVAETRDDQGAERLRVRCR